MIMIIIIMLKDMGGRKFVGRNKEMQFDLKLFYYSAFIVTWQPETSFYLRTML